MIKPNMATMLGFLAFDAAVAQPVLDALVRHVADRSFNCITIDGDTSTNDSFILIASGKSTLPAITSTDSAAYAALRDAVTDRALQDGYPERATLAARPPPGRSAARCPMATPAAAPSAFPPPTSPSAARSSPARGVYAVTARLASGEAVPGVANIGRRPHGQRRPRKPAGGASVRLRPRPLRPDDRGGAATPSCAPNAASPASTNCAPRSPPTRWTPGDCCPLR